VESLGSKVKSLQKELAALTKSTANNKKLLNIAKERAEANSGGSGTDSPSLS